MLDIDSVITDLISATGDVSPKPAIQDVFHRVVSERPAVLRSLGGAGEAGMNMLHVSPSLTIMHVVWPPGFRMLPHNHLMWSAISVLGGVEDNIFFRASPQQLRVCGQRRIVEGDVAPLDDNVIHSVLNPTMQYTSALHVYLGDITAAPTQQWDPVTGRAAPYNRERVGEQMEASNLAGKLE